MATYSFTETANKNVRIQASGISDVNSVDKSVFKIHIKEYRIGKQGINDALVVDLANTEYDGDYVMYPAVDTITIGDTTYPPGTKTVAQLKTICDSSPVFLDANTGSGDTAPATVSFNDIMGAPEDNEALNQSLIDAANNAPYKERTAAYTATPTDRTINCTSGTFTVTLPPVSNVTHYQFNIINSGSGTITVDSTSNFNGAGSISLLPGHGVQLQEGNTQYVILSQY